MLRSYLALSISYSSQSGLISFSYCLFISLCERGAVSRRRESGRAVNQTTFLFLIALESFSSLIWTLSELYLLPVYKIPLSILFIFRTHRDSHFPVLLHVFTAYCLPPSSIYSFPLNFMLCKSLPYITRLCYYGSVRCLNYFKSSSKHKRHYLTSW